MLYYSLPNKLAQRGNESFSAIDIPFPTNVANVAEITLTGRYPESGFAMNTESEMIVRILEGQTTFECANESINLPAGSTILVQKNRPYCWTPRNDVKMLVVSSPPWTPEQYRNISG